MDAISLTDSMATLQRNSGVTHTAPHRFLDPERTMTKSPGASTDSPRKRWTSLEAKNASQDESRLVPEKGIFNSYEASTYALACSSLPVHGLIGSLSLSLLSLSVPGQH